ncbi:MULTISPECIES: DUF3466 family protein [Gammaproteobacteria]|uniref:DUF3466 family protein n=1 Tax=Gammaproteobacteria TaxID=1236 RepID=UPI000DD02841|nr:MULTISPECIES: DUF3466 family protein [Gammaproteobacteria]RTE87222.1 DUF3466 family protein [Aliidiomarina sp. B3213]TCZ92990.1 DUF3466 family protein [Lysobacter sp. N42]
MQFNKKSAAIAIAAILSGVSASAHANQGYEIVEVGTLPTAFSSVGTDINDSGVVTGYGYDILNQPIRVDLLDTEADIFAGIEDFNNLTAGEYRFLRNYLLTTGGAINNPTFQKIRIAEGFTFDGNFMSLNDVFDEIEPNTGTLSYSNSFYPQNIDNSGNTIGTTQAPFIQQLGQTAQGDEVEYFTPARLMSGYWSNGASITYLTGADDLIFGGVSRASAMNDSGQIVGFAGLTNRTSLQLAYEDCIAEEVENNNGDLVPNDQIPLGACIYRVWAAAEYNGSYRVPLYNEQAYMWQVDANGNVLSKQALGVTFEVPEDSTGFVRSHALDINNNGVAVGYTDFREGDNLSNFADIYTADGAQQIFPEDADGYGQSQALLINDNGYIAGLSSLIVGTGYASRMFITTVDEAGQADGVVYPDGFFADSEWVPRDINNQNQIVGRAETEEQTSQGRTSGFLYDIELDVVTDLNDVLPCDSGYRIIEAKAINEQGEILVIAMTNHETTVDGRDFEGDSVQALVLRPSDTATPCDDGDDLQKREGASASPIQLGFLALVSVFAFITRRKKLKIK